MKIQGHNYNRGEFIKYTNMASTDLFREGQKFKIQVEVLLMFQTNGGLSSEVSTF